MPIVDTDARTTPEAAPEELVSELLTAIMAKDYERGQSLVERVLSYEPRNELMLEYRQVLQRAMKQDADGDSSDDASDGEESESDGSDASSSSSSDDDDDEAENDVKNGEEPRKPLGEANRPPVSADEMRADMAAARSGDGVFCSSLQEDGHSDAATHQPERLDSVGRPRGTALGETKTPFSILFAEQDQRIRSNSQAAFGIRGTKEELMANLRWIKNNTADVVGSQTRRESALPFEDFE